MERFDRLRSRVVPLLASDIDTDQIIPARFLKVTGREGLRDGLFASWRKDPAFVLNQPESGGARILLVGANFGCGSSREHAPWALLDWGFRVVVALSFADIFHANALKNGLLPVVVEPQAHRALAEARAADPALALVVDLAEQSLSAGDAIRTEFPVDPFAKRCLLQGIDSLDYLLSFAPRIKEYEDQRDAG
ncbi:MAG: 3-isopropylmalate dehydratase small subunit [Proteobacteria bacterium]|nr:3-isopropylmalate dehydratase small subunit [Pseudomonadota bacterium]